MDEKFIKQLKTIVTEVLDEKLAQKLDEKLKPLHGEIALLKKAVRDVDMQSMKISLLVETQSKDLARIESKVEQLQQSSDALISDVADLQNESTTGSRRVVSSCPRFAESSFVGLTTSPCLRQGVLRSNNKNDATYDLVKILYEKMGDQQQEIKTIKKHINLPVNL